MKTFNSTLCKVLRAFYIQGKLGINMLSFIGSKVLASILLSFMLLIMTSQLATASPNDTNVKTLTALNKKTLDPVFKEISGLASTKKKYWGLNDGGGEAALYSVDKKNYSLRNVVSINDAINIDWEDLAQDEEYLYISDSGNNFAFRQIIDIYKVSKKELLKTAINHSIDSERISITYADQDNFLPMKKHNFDSEALTVVGEKLWLFSKNRKDQQTKLYIIDKHAKKQTVKPIIELPVQGLITAVDYNPKTKKLIFMGYSKSSAFGHSFIWVVNVENDLPQWQSANRYKLRPYAQWESIKWTSSKTFIAAAEKSGLSSQSIAEFIIP